MSETHTNGGAEDGPRQYAAHKPTACPHCGGPIEVTLTFAIATVAAGTPGPRGRHAWEEHLTPEQRAVLAECREAGVLETFAAAVEHMPPQSRPADSARFFLTWLVGIVALWVLHPSIGMTDSDAYSYIIVAQSLQNGQGYHDLLGNALNHFPPGYSLLLSLTPNPIVTAQVLNYACFGGVLVFIYLLARRSGWNAAASLAVTTALGSGFLRSLAVSTRPDILTYFIFLAATWLFLQTEGWGRLIAYFLWSSLIPAKLIAVVFAPGVLLAEWYLYSSVKFWQRWPEYVAAVCFWGLFMAGLILFNY
jgi:hypothetical protein